MSVVLCLINDDKEYIRTYSTMTDDLPALSDWLVPASQDHELTQADGCPD